MRNLKKVISVVLVFALMLSLTVFAGAAGFADVPDNHQYKNAIDLLSALNILGGYEDGTFKPDKEITRAEFAKILYVVYQGVDDLNATLFSGETIFTDVAKNQWFAGYVNWAVNSGIVGGYGDGTFMPDNKIKVKEAIKMIVAAVTDKTLVYPMGHIQEAKALKLLNGVTIADIEANATRGQIAQMAYNLLSTPSKLCLEPAGVINGVEQYNRVDPMTYVFNLEKFDGDVVVVGSYDNKFIATQAIKEGQVALKVKGVEKVVNYAGDASELLAQNVVVYYKDVNANETVDDKDVIFNIVPKGAILNTTLKGLTLSGTTFKVDGVAINAPSPAVFEKVYTQNTDGTFAEVTDKLVYTEYFKKQTKNNPVTLIDKDGDGDYDYLIQYAVFNAAKVDLYNTTSKTIRLKSAVTHTIKFENVVGLSSIALNDVVNYTMTLNGKGEQKVVVAKAQVVTGKVTSVAQNGASAVIGGYTYSVADDYKTAFNTLANGLINKNITVYLDSLGQIVKAEAETTVTTTSLNLAYVKEVADDYSVGRDGKANLTATITLVLPDGTEKTYNMDTSKTKDTIFKEGTTAYAWAKATPETSDEDGDGYKEFYWEYNKVSGKDVADIVGKYINYKLSSNKVVEICAIDDVAKVLGADYSVKTYTPNNLCYSDEYGFYKLSGKTVRIEAIAADNMVVMYYNTSKKAAEVYTKATLPEFEKTKDTYQLVFYKGEVVAAIVLAKPTVSTSETVFGILKGYQKVTGADAKKTRWALTVTVNGKDQVYYTADGKELTVLTNNADKNYNLTLNKLVTIKLTDGKLNTIEVDHDGDPETAEVTVVDLEYVLVDSFKYAIVVASNSTGTALNLTEVTAWTNDTAGGYELNKTTGAIEWKEGTPGNITLGSALGWMTVVDETNLYTIDGRLANAASSSALFQNVSKLGNGARVEITNVQPTGSAYEAYLIAFQTYTTDAVNKAAHEVLTNNPDLEGCLANVIVFTTPILVDNGN